MTDQELWQRIRAGDQQRFEEFYRAHAGRVLQFLHRTTGDRQASEDLTQEVFVELWNHANGYNAERGDLIAYVFGIARKRAAEWWRRRNSSIQNVSQSPDTHIHAENVLPAILVEDAFLQLNESDRALLWLREIEGRTYAELAAIFDVPLGTIRSRLFSAREELRRLWKHK